MEVIQLESAFESRHVLLHHIFFSRFCFCFSYHHGFAFYGVIGRFIPDGGGEQHPSKMSSPFFAENWEDDTQETLFKARAKVEAFIEVTTDSRIKTQLRSVMDCLVPCQDAIRLQSAFLLVSNNIFCKTCTVQAWGEKSMS